MTGSGVGWARVTVYGGLLVAAVGSVGVPKIALFVLVGAFIAFVALPRKRPRALLVLSVAAGVAATIGFVRFLVHEAMPGIVQGGTLATGAAAVTRLRQFVVAQDAMRKLAPIDPDGDGVGSAAFLDELTGRVGLRGGAPLTPPLLERLPASVETSTGPAVEVNGYLFLICLPRPDGGFTARPGEAVDDELAERRFVAYAWPVSESLGLLEAYFIDEHERILFTRSGAPKGQRPRIGRDRAPPCDDALAPATREAWQVWRGKRPRTDLPGDKPPRSE